MRDHFGFQHDPFPLVPDPAGLFLGRHHEEALAHLRYALAENEGFTAITGERGVGKTTVCRAFVEGLAEGDGVAFVAAEGVRTPLALLAAILRGFGVATAPGADGKTMIDALNAHLMEQRLAGRRVSVFIDDAHRLPVEALEQVRLLSNLETTREKLIQIVLIGEPPLARMLDSHALRQMGQRVSVRYRIGPFTAAETAAYIQHRLSRAAAGPPLRFEPEAMQLIHRHTGGNPRAIHIACQAILAAAFRAGKREIDAATARTALEAIAPPADRRRRIPRPAHAAATAVVAALLAGIAVGAAVLWRGDAGGPAPELAAPAPPEAGAPPAPNAPAPADPKLPAAPAPEPATPASRPAADRPAPRRPTHSVQTGAFLHPENAAQEAARLAGRGYAARVVVVTDSQGRVWHTVRIGDHPDRAAAESQAAEFARREQARPVVRPHGAF